jgi:hypothetical protein
LSSITGPSLLYRVPAGAVDINGWPEATLDGALEGRADGSAERPADRVPVGADGIEGWPKATFDVASDGFCGGRDAAG